MLKGPLIILNPSHGHCCPSLQALGLYWGHAFFVIRGGEGGGEILEEAGTFSGQALLLSYPYPRGGGSSQGGRHPLTALSTVPTQYQTTRNASSREGLTTAC